MVTQYKKIFLLLSVFTGLGNSVFSQNQSYGEIDRVPKMYIEGQYLNVINYLENEKKEPLTSNEYYFLGMSYAQLKNLKKALTGLEKAVELDSLKIIYRLNFARYLFQYGRTNEAITHYNFIIDKDSTNIIALFELGMVNLPLRDFEEVKRIFTKVCSLNENDFLARYYLALSQANTASTAEDSSNVFISISKAISLNFEYIPSWELAGSFAIASKNYMYGFGQYIRLTQLNPNKAEYFYRAGFCAEKVKHYDMAIGLLNKAIKRDSTIANFYSHLGFCYFAVGEFDSALVAYKNAVLFDDVNPANDINVALTYEKLDSLNKANIYYESALQKYPYDKIIYTLEKLAAVNYRLGNFNRALIFCDRALNLDPNSVQSLFYMACTLDRFNKTSKALEYYKKALAELIKDEKFSKETEYVNEQITQIESKVKERKFWEGSK
jgi:tetratricopeptide (TPR) repeat protein